MKFSKPAMILLILLLAGWAAAQGTNLTGTWKAQTKSPQGTSEQTIILKQTGSSFTGEMITSQGSKEAIKGGTVKEDAFEFIVERPRPGGATAQVVYKGKVKGDEITGTFTGATGREIEWTAKRQKP